MGAHLAVGQPHERLAVIELQRLSDDFDVGAVVGDTSFTSRRRWLPSLTISTRVVFATRSMM